MSYRPPHAQQGYPSNKEIYSDKKWQENKQILVAKNTLLEQQMARLLKKLEAMVELENTLIIFTSDNGSFNVSHDPEFFNSSGH